MSKTALLSYSVAALLLASIILPLQSVYSVTKSPCEKYFTNQGKPGIAKRCRTVQVISHRAQYSGGETTNENTLKALQYTGKLGVGCETDTWRLASDNGDEAQGISVIFHDQTIGRVVTNESIIAAREATGTSEVDLNSQTKMSKVTYAQFKHFKTTGGESLPTLKQWINYAAKHKIPCKIEIKWKPSIDELVATVSKLRATKMLKKISFWNAPTPTHACSTASMEAMINDSDLSGMVVGFKQSSGCPLSPQELSDKGFKYTTTPGNLSQKQRNQFVKAVHKLNIQAGAPVSSRKTFWKQNVLSDIDYIMTNNPKALRNWLRG